MTPVISGVIADVGYQMPYNMLETVGAGFDTASQPRHDKRPAVGNGRGSVCVNNLASLTLGQSASFYADILQQKIMQLKAALFFGD